MFDIAGVFKGLDRFVKPDSDPSTCLCGFARFTRFFFGVAA